MRVITLDPGHGGKATGAVSGGVYEKVFTLETAKRTAHYIRLLSQDASRVPQVSAFLTREDDYDVAIADRALQAIHDKADLFISIHFNASARPEAVSGAEAYIAQVVGNNYEWTSNKLAKSILASVSTGTGLRNRGVKADTLTAPRRLGVLRGVMGFCPGVLVEPGYLSNQHDRLTIALARGREEIAIAIAEAAVAFLGIPPRLELV